DNLSLLSQHLLDLLAVVDVSSGSVPLDDAPCVVTCWHGASKKPAILPVMAAVADFDFIGRARRERPAPLRHTALVIIGMKHQLGPVAGELLRRHTAIIEPLLTDEGHRAIRSCGPDERGH